MKIGPYLIRVVQVGMVAGILGFVTQVGVQAARTRPGPVTIRGTVIALQKGGFTLHSPSKGDFEVSTSRLTAFGRRSNRVTVPATARSVVLGAHVGARGYVSGHRLQAISVTIYIGHHRVKPKEETLRGLVVSEGVGWLNMTVGGRRVHIRVPAGTPVEERRLPVSLSRAKHGQRVDVRCYGPAGALVATRVTLLVIHVRHPATQLVHGIVAAIRPGGFVVRTTANQVIFVRYAGRVRPGQPVSVRVYQDHGVYIATRVRVLRALAQKTSLMRGTVVAVGRGWIRVGSGRTSAQFAVTAATRVRLGAGAATAGTLARGQRVAVRYLRQGSALTATSIHIYSSRSAAHARTQEIKGTVVGVRSGFVTVKAGAVDHTFEVSAATKIRLGSSPASAHALHFGQRVSIRFVPSSKTPMATSIHIYSTRTVTGAKTQEVRGTVAGVRGNTLVVHVGAANRTFALTAGTHITHGSHPATSAALLPGQSVSVRYRGSAGAAVATSIHIYSAKVAHARTKEWRGTVEHVQSGSIAVRAGGQTRVFAVGSTTRVSDGSRAASLGALSAGQTVSVHYYAQGNTQQATSIHIYVSAAHMHVLTGVVTGIRGNVMTMTDRGAVRTVFLSASTIITNQSHPSTRSSLKTGQRVHVRGTLDAQNHVHAVQIDIVPGIATRGGKVKTPAAVHGTIVGVGGGVIALQSATGVTTRVRLSSRTRVVVRTQRIPTSWLYAGPSATIALAERSGSIPTAVVVSFRPKSHSLSGLAVATTGKQLTVQEAAGVSAVVSLEVAHIVDGGRAVRQVALGSHVRVGGFLLSGGAEAALTVVVTHPVIRVDGLVTAVSGLDLTVQTATGANQVLHFPPGVTALATATGQRFPVSVIPAGSRVRASGVRSGTIVVVTAATVTLKAVDVRSTVEALTPDGFTLTQSGSSLMVHLTAETRITVGRSSASSSTIMIGDDVTVRGYPDIAGGLLAHSVELHRRSTTRTGDISNLQAGSFDLVRRDGSIVHVLLDATTSVSGTTGTVSLSALANGQHVTVTGHLRPDGAVDATRIVIK